MMEQPIVITFVFVILVTVFWFLGAYVGRLLTRNSSIHIADGAILFEDSPTHPVYISPLLTLGNSEVAITTERSSRPAQMPSDAIPVLGIPISDSVDAPVGTDLSGNEPALGGDLKLPSWGASSYYQLNFYCAEDDLMPVATLVRGGNIIHHIIENGLHHYLYIEGVHSIRTYSHQAPNLAYEIYVRGKLYIGDTRLSALNDKALEIPPVIHRFELTMRNYPPFAATMFW